MVEQKVEDKDLCIDNQPHDWRFKERVNQPSGIARSWYKEYYYCTKCLKTRVKSGYYDEL